MCFSRAASHYPNYYFSVRIEGAKNAEDFLLPPSAFDDGRNRSQEKYDMLVAPNLNSFALKEKTEDMVVYGTTTMKDIYQLHNEFKNKS